MEKSASFNIVIFPPEEIAKKAIAVSQLFQDKQALFVLNNKDHFSHITLYMVELPLKNIPKATSILEKIAKETVPFELVKGRYRQDHHGYIDVSFSKTVKISALQKSIIKKINLLREGLIKPGDRRMIPDLKKTELRNLKLYGSGFVFDQWTPHMTFTKLKDSDKTALSNIKEEDFSFSAQKLGIFYLGEYGTCRKKITLFDLKS